MKYSSDSTSYAILLDKITVDSSKTTYLHSGIISTQQNMKSPRKAILKAQSSSFHVTPTRRR